MNDFIHETNYLLSKSRILVKLIIEEIEFILLNDKLIEISTNNICLDIIIYSDRKKKSLSLVNLLSDLIS